MYITIMDGALAMRTLFRFFELHLGYSQVFRVLCERGYLFGLMSTDFMFRSMERLFKCHGEAGSI
jgi:hypothetical protein